jgi:transposase-like protein
MSEPKMKCPECGSDMKETKGGFYQCQNPKCKGYYIPYSRFGIT